MRRLVLILPFVVLLAVGPAAAKIARPWPTLVAGAAHGDGAKIKGWFVAKDTAKRRTRPAKAYVMVGDGTGATSAGYREVPTLRPGERRVVHFVLPLPTGIPAGKRKVNVCTGGHCLHVASLKVDSSAADPPGGTKAGEAGPHSLGALPPQAPTSTVPTEPIAYPTAEPFFHAGGGAEYWGFVPRSYDPSNQTPMKLLVWAHGCGGHAEADARLVDPGIAAGVEQDWMTLSLGGREGQCWAPSVDEAKEMAALADFETHFNVDRRQVLLGGYSAGGDLAYRTGFRHSSTFAGLLVENSSPFRDTESTEAESLAAATTKLHVAHLAHTGDDIYRIEEIQAEVGAMRAAGFPVDFIERPGGHSDSQTNADLLTYLVPYIDAGWTAPEP